MQLKWNLLAVLCLFLLVTFGCATGTNSARPAAWAAPVSGAAVKNCYKVTDDIYRSAQPSDEAADSLKGMGIKSILNLRSYHKDSEEFAQRGIVLYDCSMNAGSASVRNLTEALKIIQNAPKPILIHCWHGCDSTGFVIAGYRVVMQGWSAEKAIDELRNGGYGYNESEFPNIMKTLRNMDVQAVQKAVLAP